MNNVHDTQAWHMAKDGSSFGQSRQTTRPGLNATLEAYGFKANTTRDKSVYRANPNFWETRPLTTEMIKWASEDVGLLVPLSKAQVEQADAKIADVARTASSKRVGAMRDRVVRNVQVHHSQMGNFIGKGGANISELERACKVSFQQRHVPNGLFMIYANSNEDLDAAVRRVEPFTKPYSRRS